VVDDEEDEPLAPESRPPSTPASPLDDELVLLVEDDDETSDVLLLLDGVDVLTEDVRVLRLLLRVVDDFFVDVAPPLPPCALAVLVAPPLPPPGAGSALSIPASCAHPAPTSAAIDPPTSQ
jgi:hypothetical protein